MHAIIVRWLIRPEHVEAFLDLVRWHIAETRRTEPGCLRFDLCRDVENPRAFWIYELYRDDAALAAHAQSPSLPKLRAKVPEWAEDRQLVNATLLNPA
jgi:quinol monooxygenase YgiN